MCNSPDLDEPRCPPAKRQTIRELLFRRVAPACAVSVLLMVSAPPAQAAADLYIKDTPADTGAEPNPDPGPMWVSEDIWVRQNPFPGHQPYPFTVDPAWLTAIVPLHQNPEYRDPKYSKPNYVYVRVRNRGDAASTGTERLRVYWAKASTGLSWPSQWVDYIAANCGPNKLYGIEITKPRRNRRWTTTGTPSSPSARCRLTSFRMGCSTGTSKTRSICTWSTTAPSILPRTGRMPSSRGTASTSTATKPCCARLIRRSRCSTGIGQPIRAVKRASRG